MSNQDQPINLDRRKFFATVGVAAGSVAVGALVANRASAAADLPHLLETDALAVSMNYKEDAAKVDTKKFPNFKAGQNCSSCQFYQGAAGYGPCQIFAGKAVSSKGWCQVWAQKKA
jgi:hypothetical protein